MCFFFSSLDCWFSWKCLIFQSVTAFGTCFEGVEIVCNRSIPTLPQNNLHPNEKVRGLVSVLDNSWSPWRATSPTSAALLLTSQAVWSDFSPKYNCQCVKHASYIWLQKQPVLFETDGSVWSGGPRANGRNNNKDGNPVSQVHIKWRLRSSVFAEWCASHQVTPPFLLLLRAASFFSLAFSSKTMKWMSWLPRVFSFFFLDHLISVWTHGRVETNYLHDLASLTFIADMFVLAKTNLKNMRTVFGRYDTLAFTPVKLVGQMVDFRRSDTRLSYTLFMPFIHICSVCLRWKSRLVKMPKDGGWINPSC